eukprot:403373743
METRIENFLELFDLESDNLTPEDIIKAFKDYSDYDILDQPEIVDYKGVLSSSMAKVRINDTQEKFLDVAKKMKYFEMNGIQCMAIPYSNIPSSPVDLKIQNLNKNVTKQQLDQKFQEVLGGDYVLTVFIDFNPDKTSKGHGSVLFNNEEGAKLALEKAADGEFDFEVRAEQYIQALPNVQKEVDPTFNVISIKNFPIDWNKEMIEKIFSQYGNIKSATIIIRKNKKTQLESPFALVRYELPQDKNCGPISALEAILHENDKQYDGFKLKVKQANYQSYKVKSIIYNTKSIRQLHIKNIPENATEEQLRVHFEKYGEIESFLGLIQ